VLPIIVYASAKQPSLLLWFAPGEVIDKARIFSDISRLPA
jgi:hypothetical protein